MSAAGLALLAVGLVAAKSDVGRARGLGRIPSLTYICFAVPLAVFGAEHLSSGQAMAAAVPSYMPWRTFWVYFVGFALIAASLSIATKRHVLWSGLLFAAMMLLFVALLHLPRALSTGGRIAWTIVFREMSFGGAALVLAGMAMGNHRGVQSRGRNMIIGGSVLIALTAIFFGVQHFLHPLGLPGVPLEKQMPPWVPLRPLIGYVTGAFLLSAGISFLVQRRTRVVATYAGAWILLLVIVVYVPVLVGALADPSTPVQIEGLNYFADTLLFSGVIFSLAESSRSQLTDD